MIVFRFDDLTTIGNHVRNMPCGSPCRFAISKGGDSSATVVLTSNGTTLSATTEDISPFSTDEYVGFDIVTPEESANIPYHAVITGTNEVHDIDFILNCNRQTLCGDMKHTIKIDDLDSIGSHSYTVPTNSYIGLEAEVGVGVFSFPTGVFPSQSNALSASTSIKFSDGFTNCSQTQILTPNTVGTINTVATVEVLDEVEDGVYVSGKAKYRFTGYNEEKEADYIFDVYPKETVSCSRIVNGETVEKTTRFEDIVIRDLQENVIASASFFFVRSSVQGGRNFYWYYAIENSTISGDWKDYYPLQISHFSRNGNEPAIPQSVYVDAPKQPDNRTEISCEGEPKYVYVSKPSVKQFDVTITTKDTGFSYSK